MNSVPKIWGSSSLAEELFVSQAPPSTQIHTAVPGTCPSVCYGTNYSKCLINTYNTISEYTCSILSEPHNHMHSTLSEPHNHMYNTMSEPHNHMHSTMSEPHNHMHCTMSEPHKHMCHTMSEPHNHMYIFLHSTSTVRFSSDLNTIQYARKNTRFSTTYSELHNMYCSTDTLYSRIQEG